MTEKKMLFELYDIIGIINFALYLGAGISGAILYSVNFTDIKDNQNKNNKTLVYSHEERRRL